MSLLLGDSFEWMVVRSDLVLQTVRTVQYMLLLRLIVAAATYCCLLACCWLLAFLLLAAVDQRTVMLCPALRRLLGNLGNLSLILQSTYCTKQTNSTLSLLFRRWR